MIVWIFVLDCTFVIFFLFFLILQKKISTGVAWLSEVRGAIPFLYVFIVFTDIVLSKSKNFFFFWWDKEFDSLSLKKVHVKSSWPLYTGLHLCYNRMYNLFFLLWQRKKKKENENILFFGFCSATRTNEDGIMSNRGWACHGEFSKFLESTHRPSHSENFISLKKKKTVI